MNSYDEIDLLAKEIVKGHPLIKCLNISIALDRLMQHREENINTLYQVADKLDKHARKSSIAKCVGSAVGTQGKVALGVGIAALLGAPLTGFISTIVGAALLTGGGAAAALGTATSAGTYATEYMLCKKQLSIANKFIAVDKRNVEEYQKDIDELTVFCSQYDNADTVKIVLELFSKFKDFISSEKVDFKGIAKQMGINEEDIPTKIRQLIIKGFNQKSATWVTTTVSFLSRNPAVLLAGGGVSILLLDVFVLFKNTYNLAANEGHPTANELRIYASNLEKETEKLKTFSQFFKQQIHDRPEAKSTSNQKKYPDTMPEDKDDEPKGTSCQNDFFWDDETDLVPECSSDEYESAAEILD